MFFGFTSQGINFALSNYMLSFIWRLDSHALQIYALALGGGVISSMWLAAAAGRRFGKPKAASILALIAPIVGTSPYWFYIARLFPDTTQTGGFALYLCIVALATALGVSAMIIGASMICLLYTSPSPRD